MVSVAVDVDPVAAADSLLGEEPPPDTFSDAASSSIVRITPARRGNTMIHHDILHGAGNPRNSEGSFLRTRG